MRSRLIRRAAAAIGVITLATAGLTMAGQAATAKPVQRVHLLRTVAPVRTLARVRHRRGPQPALRCRRPRAGGRRSLDAELYRKHNANEADLEGGDAVHEGEVARTERHVASGASGSKGTSWEGSNHFDSRYSGGGNQFSGEPPDQGLCASNSREFEIVNQVMQVYTRNGTPLLQGTSGAPGSPGRSGSP